MKSIYTLVICFMSIVFIACKNNNEQIETNLQKVQKELFTCPMTEDSIFSNKAGTCPKCGMDLVKVESKEEKIEIDDLESLIKPTNEFVIASIPVITLKKSSEQITIETIATINYDTKHIGNISSRVAGRIEKLYVRYRFQKIEKGQLLFEIYSPELNTVQKNLLLFLSLDSSNHDLLNASKEKLVQLGMSRQEIQQLIQTGKTKSTISIYSDYSGHLHEVGNSNKMGFELNEMKETKAINELLSIKEGMYFEKGQIIFSVYNPNYVWAVLTISNQMQPVIQLNNSVKIISETSRNNEIKTSIDFIEPFYRIESKFLTVRTSFDNSKNKIPIGSQVNATIFGKSKNAYWLPITAVLNLGAESVVFVKNENGFKIKKIKKGITYKNLVEIISGVSLSDSVANDAQFLIDSESYIKLKK